MDEQGATQQAPEPRPAPGRAASAGQPGPAAEVQPVRAGERPLGADVRLTREEAEQVIRRALELQDAQQVGGDPGLSFADVQDIAKQLGVDTTLVRRARTEVRVARQADTGLQGAEQLIGPRRVAAARLVAAEPTPVRGATADWMSRDEGMTRTGTRGQTDRWVRDKRLLVQLRRGLQADRGSGVLRDLDGVLVTITPDPEGTIVAVDADTTRVRTAGGVIAATGAVVGAGIGVSVAALVPDAGVVWGDAAQFTAAFLPAVAVGLGTSLAVTRTWTAKVRKAVEQALDGIAMTTDAPRLPPLQTPDAAGWRSTVVRWLGGQS